MDESALLGIFDEIEDICDFRCHGKLLADGGDGLGQGHAALVDDAVGFVDGVDDLALETATAQPHNVEAVVGSRMAGADGVGEHALWHACAAADHRVAADAAELVNQDAGREDGVVIDGDFAGELRAVADDDVVADDVVVGDVGALHE